jgi:hypothetical protein
MVRVFGEEYFIARNAQDTARLLEYNKSLGFLGMLAQLIACNGAGRTAPQHGMESSKDTKRISLSFLKSLPILRLGFGIFLICPVLAMISMFFNGFH